MSKAVNDLTKILGKLSKTVQEAIDRVTMKKVGDFAALLVVKRTRLGYGVKANFGEKKPLAILSDNYIKFRKREGVDSTSRPTKSNLTKTGKMLKSVKAKYKSKGVVIITPTGTRTDGETNENIAQYNADNSPSRVFNRVSKLEFQQILRYYRKTFGDLVKKSSKGSLIR
jgi:hypothetical protein